MEGGRLRFECTCAAAGEYELVVVDDSDTRIVGSATVSPGPLHTFKVVETEAMKNVNKGTTDHWLEVRLRSLDAYGNPCPCPEGCDLHLEAAAIFSPNALRGATEGDFFCRRPLVPKSGKNPLFSARLEWDAKPSGVGKVHEYVLGCVMMNGKMMPLSFAKGESPVVEKANKVDQAKKKKAEKKSISWSEYVQKWAVAPADIREIEALLAGMDEKERLKRQARVVDYPQEVGKGLLFGHHRRTSSAAPSDSDQDEFETVDSEID
jgi:hypothetical protein